MKRIIAVSALLALFSGAALADNAFNTTGGYGGVLIDTKGAAYVNQDSLSPTYAYTATDVTPVATATDVVVIAGSATKTIRIKSVCIGGTATAASVYDVYLYKRTVADTGGTATNPVPVQFDSNSSAAASTVSLYTANPTVGTGVLISGSKMVLVNGATPAAQNLQNCWDFGRGGSKPILRGVAQSLAISHNGAAVPSGASIYYTVTWTED
jgi:hypothetical protein